MHLLANTGERVLVIGSGGVLGSLTSQAFEQAGWEVLRANRIPAKRADWRRVDLDLPETVIPALEGVDVVVDAVPHPGLVAEQSILERGGVLLNTATLPMAWARALRAGRSSPVGTVVFGAGIAPGLTNLVAAELLATHPDADELEFAFTLWTGATSGRRRAEFVHRNLTAVSRHDTTVVPLPAPFGARRCLGFAEPERGWIDELAGPRIVRSYACFGEVDVHEAVLADNERGALAELPVAAFAAGQAAHPPSSEPVAHWVCVRRAGTRIAARTIRCAGGYRSAAHATVALAQVLQDARARAPLAKGIFGPEDLIAFAELGPYLAAAGINVVAEPV